MATRPQVHGNRIELAEHGRNHWHVKSEAIHTPDDAIDPGYLWNQHERIKAGDFVDIAHENFKWIVRLYVVKVDDETQGILSRVLEKHDWRNAAVPKADLVEAEVGWGGPVHKWRVTRGSSILKAGFTEKSEAEDYLAKLNSQTTAGAEQKAA